MSCKKYKVEKNIRDDDYIQLCQEKFHDVILESMTFYKDRNLRNDVKINADVVFSDLNLVYLITYFDVKKCDCSFKMPNYYMEIGDYIDGFIEKKKDGYYRHSFSFFENNTNFEFQFKNVKCKIIMGDNVNKEYNCKIWRRRNKKKFIFC